MIATGTLMLLFAAPASASTRSSTATAVHPYGPAPLTATATCPRGRRATGGGFSAPPSVGSYGVFQSMKSGNRSWIASIFLWTFAASDRGQITTYVYCDKDAPRTKTATASAAAAPLAFSPPAVATCGSGRKVLAGGFSVTNNTVPPDVFSSFRSSNKSWQVSGNNNIGNSNTFTSYAYCAKADAPKARSAIMPSALDGGDVTATSPRCPKHTIVQSGGFHVPNPDKTTPGLYETPSSSLKVGKAWQTIAFHDGTASTTLISTAYCA
jgi:hypothetical protein